MLERRFIMRKISVIILSVAMLFIPLTAFASPENTGIDTEARAAVLVDASSGKLMYEKNASQKLPIASVTKVMTLDLIFDAVEDGTLSLDEDITVSAEAAGMGGSQAFIDAGYSYKASELIKSIIIASANDAAVAMAERLAGSEEAFTVKMNKKAQKLGMHDTVFKNCTGLPAEGHLSTALDVAKMSAELLKHEDYFRWSTTWMDEIKHAKDGRVTELVNTNKLIRSLAGCDGLKTGSTSEAKFCVTTTAKRGDMRLIAVVLGGSTSQNRFADAAKLINYGFANYEMKTVTTAGQEIGTVTLKGGKEDSVRLIAKTGYSVCVANDESEELTTRIDIPENISAPVSGGDVIGKLTVSLNGKDIKAIELVADRDYLKASFFDKFKKIVTFRK